MTRAQRDRLLAEGLVRLADRCSEALASAADPATDAETLAENIADINLLVWRLRWDVGPSGGECEMDTVDAESAQVGGAS